MYLIKRLWKKYLPIVEFAFNNTVHSSTGKAPFEIMYGQTLPPPLVHTKEKVFAAEEFCTDYQKAFEQVKQVISKAQAKQQNASNKGLRDVHFQDNGFFSSSTSKDYKKDKEEQDST